MQIKFNKKFCCKCLKKHYKDWDTSNKFFFAHGMHCPLIESFNEGEVYFVPENCPYWLELIINEVK